ncbi:MULTISPECIES: HaaA family cyclophane-containing RiPP peptide [Streptomyces]|uniref:FXSXX-COOH protein n=1 Tax=Streptomyces griseoaurantiacus TaxID=68213 RepID=A0ABZ1UYS5_9ACTN|nr:MULTISPECIES: HaaA family cyclophane-containing RiPP peptide [Streptomyces]MDX3089161.1 hypothetical protein [Streptomyces sp. ME12-02E]MDX3332550.1 hypothetical protein [Streptomyces sp. ME02-6978a]GHE65276.1 hypothetical protein GCM10018782_44170 [Streptomyces griseoaurantiacus]
MTSPTSVPTPRDIALSTRSIPDSTTRNAVLDQVAERVRRRLTTEQDTPDRFHAGTHAASLTWSCPA